MKFMSVPKVEVEGLRKVYGTGSERITAVDGVSFSVEEGEVVGLLGPNGAGKTTTIKCCLGLVSATAGNISVAGIDPQENPKAAYEHVSALLEGARNLYWRLTPEENLRYFAGCQGIHPNDAGVHFDRIFDIVGLSDHVDVPVRNLSRGLKQKASLACALVRQTPVLVLDEPTLGLDVGSAVDIRGEIRRLATEENRTILLSSHNMKVVKEACDRVVIIQNGEVVTADSVEELTDIFRSQSYELTFPPGAGIPERLADFSIEPVENGARPTVEVVLEDSHELYELMEECRSADIRIDRIESVEPDMEDVFLTVVEDEGTKREVTTQGDGR